MWIEKLTNGVLQLDTPIGPRYVRPKLLQRAYLIWTFRNFFSLPQSVLRSWERRLIDRLWSENRFVSMPATALERAVIGRIERATPPRDTDSDRKPVAGSKTVGSEGEEAASA